MRRVANGLGGILILGAIIAFGWFFGLVTEAALDQILPKDWQKNIVPALLVIGVFYLFGQVDDLKRQVRGLSAAVDRLEGQIK